MRTLPNLFPSDPILIGQQPFSSTYVRKSHGRQEINSNLGVIGA